MWQVHDRIHQEWIAQFPASITARVAYADFLREYAWHARGTDLADKVTEEGWRLFGERLESARKMLAEARELTEKERIDAGGNYTLMQARAKIIPSRGLKHRGSFVLTCLMCLIVTMIVLERFHVIGILHHAPR